MTNYAQAEPNHPLTAIRRQGVVQDVTNAPTTVNVFLGGDANTLVPCAYLADYSPAAGDTVMVLVNQGDYLIIGACAGLTPQTAYLGSASNAGSVDIVTTNATLVTITVTLVLGRTYEISGYLTGSWITANGAPTVKLIAGTTFAGTELARMIPLGGGGTAYTVGQGLSGLGATPYTAAATGSQSFCIAGTTTAGALRVAAGNGTIWVKDVS
jgi:hypothetical protein